MNVVAIYAGRFQPFGPHHKASFDWLCSKFGAENCWISTSGKIDDRSPLSFEEKSSIIRKFGIENIIQSSSPYRLADSRFDPENTILFVLLGEKDEGRIQYFKKDGSTGYYKEYYGQRDLDPMNKSGYVIVAPHISIKHDGHEVSGTYLRRTLPFAPQATFSGLMGWYDVNVQKLFQERFHEEIGALSDEFEPLDHQEKIDIDTDFKVTKIRRHIDHLYEGKLTPDEIIDALTGLTNGSIPAYEKFDGINLKVSIKKGLIVSARNKADMKSDGLTIDQLKMRYSDRLNLQIAFTEGHRDCESLLQSLPSAVRNYIETNNVWLNVELVNPILDSGYKYGLEPLIVVHGAVDINGNKIDGFDIDKYLPSRQRSYTVIGPNRIAIPSMPMYIAQVAQEIRRTKTLEDVINKVGYTLLSKSSGYKAVDSQIVHRLVAVGNEVSRSTDSKLRQRYFDNLEKLDFGKILPFEGIVFDYKGRTYKLTGYYKHQNAILHLLSTK